MRVVVNTSPLIALDRIGRVDLLRSLYGTVIRPQSVLDELLAGREHHPWSSQLQGANWILTEPDPPEMVLRRELGAGETAVIALALRFGADLVVLDDLQARLVASGLGLKLTGTVGILLAAHRNGTLPDIKAVFRQLAEVGFHLPLWFRQQHGL
jgi:predicted nucleic acid-binding protein